MNRLQSCPIIEPVTYCVYLGHTVEALKNESGASRKSLRRNSLSTDAEAGNQRLITLFVFCSCIIKKTATLRNHFQKTTTWVVVFTSSALRSGVIDIGLSFYCRKPYGFRKFFVANCQDVVQQWPKYRKRAFMSPFLRVL